MLSVIKWNVWQRRWSMIWWSLASSSFILINMVFYPTFRDQATELTKSFEDLPDAALQLFGGSADFFSPVGFMNSQIFFLMLPLLLAILAVGLGSSLIGREEQRHTIESLLARPLSRLNLLTAKAIAGFLIVLIVSIVSWATIVITGKIVDLPIPATDLTLATLACFALVTSFAAVSFMLAALGLGRGISTGVAATFAFGGYLIGSLSGTVDWLKLPSKIFPFHYYASEAILRGHFQWTKLIFMVAVIVICSIVAWIGFRRRDLASE